MKNNSIQHTAPVEGSSFAALMLFHWEDPANCSGTSGNYDGSEFSYNTIDCGSNKQCGIGLMIGPDPWRTDYKCRTESGGNVHDNIIRNVQQGLTIGRAKGISICNNNVENVAQTTWTSCGEKRSSAYCKGSLSENIDFSNDSLLGRQFITFDWNGCLPNWWTR